MDEVKYLTLTVNEMSSIDERRNTDGPFYMEQTIVPAQLVRYYFYNFKVLVEKCQKIGVTAEPIDIVERKQDQSRLLESHNWQQLADSGSLPADSWAFTSDDEDIEMALKQAETEVQQKDLELTDKHDENNQKVLVSVDIQIRNTSMTIDNNESFLFGAEVRDATVIPGNEETSEQDSLLISLSSNYFLIIRIGIIDGAFEPIVIHRQTYQGLLNDKVYRLGSSLLTHKSGKIVAAAAFKNVVQFGLFSESRPVLKLTSNLTLSGLIISCCFLELISENEDRSTLFLTLIRTDNNILQLELIECFMSSSTEPFIRHGPILLGNKFEIPRFMVSLQNTSSVLLIQETKCTLKGVSYLMSHEGPDQADCDLPSSHYNSSFVPEAYYVPQTFIYAFDSEKYRDPDYKIDQVIISANNALWLLDIFYNYKQLRWSMEFRKLFSGMGHCLSFYIEEGEDEESYIVNFVGDNGVNKTINLTRRQDGNGLSFENMEDTQSKKIFAPILGLEVAKTSSSKYSSKVSSEKLWGIGKLGKSGALMNLRVGHAATKSACLSSFKKAERIFKIVHLGKPYFLISYFTHSVMISFTEDAESEQGTVKDIEGNHDDHDNDKYKIMKDESSDNGVIYYEQFHEDGRTLLFTKLENGYFLHVKEKGWRIGDFDNLSSEEFFSGSWSITMASCYKDYVVIVSDKTQDEDANEESPKKLQISVDIFQVNKSLTDSTIYILPIKLSLDVIDFQPSAVSLFENSGDLYLLISCLNPKDISCDYLHLFKFDGESQFHDLYCVSLNETQSKKNDETPKIGSQTTNPQPKRLTEQTKDSSLNWFNSSPSIIDVETQGAENLYVHEIAILPYSNDETGKKRILISTKDGRYMSIIFDKALKHELTVKVAQGPLEIIKTNHPRKFYLTSKSIWKLDFTKSYYPEKICVKEFTDRDFISAVFIDTPAEDITGRLLEDELLCIRSDGLSRLYVDQFTSPLIKQISLADTPLRMLYMSDCDTIAVIVADSTEKKLPSSDREKNITNRDNSAGDDMDVHLSDSSDEDVDITTSKYGLLKFYDQTNCKKLEVYHNSDPKYDCYFKENEQPISMLDITIQENYPRNSFKRQFLVVGCSVLQEAHSKGRIKIYEFKRTKEFVRLKLIHCTNTSHPVLTMCYLPDKKKLAYGSDTVLKYLDIPLSKSDSLNFLNGTLDEEVFEKDFIYRIIGINKPENENEPMLIATDKGSFFCFHDSSKPAYPVYHNNTLCSMMGHCLIQNKHVIAAEKHTNTVRVLGKIDSDATKSTHVEVLALRHLPFIPKLTECQLTPIWDSESGNKRNKFIANGINGEIKLFTSISESEFNKLETIHNTFDFLGDINKTESEVNRTSPNLIRNFLCEVAKDKRNEDKRVINCDFLKDKAIYTGPEFNNLLYGSLI